MRKYLLSACRKWTSSFQGAGSAEFFLPISPCPPVVHSTHLLKPSVNALSSLLAEAISLISVLLELGLFYCMIYCGLAIISCGYVCPSREPVRARTVFLPGSGGDSCWDSSQCPQTHALWPCPPGFLLFSKERPLLSKLHFLQASSLPAPWPASLRLR